MGQLRIRWRQPSFEPPRDNFLVHLPSRGLAGRARAPGSFRQLADSLAEAGIPAIVGAASARDDAIGLLMLAAEVEHALMVQYLYACQSVRGATARTIRNVAVQEMGHLLTVQNLLLAVTGETPDGLPARLHLARDGLRRYSGRNPLPFVLEQVSHAALAKFVVVERPQNVADATLAARLIALEAEAQAAGAMPHPVHALYAAIRWIFQRDDTTDQSGLGVQLGLKPGWHLSDTDFADPAVIAKFAATAEEWGAVPGLIVSEVRDQGQGLAAIDAITAQGEGTPGDEDSHFARFLDILDAFEANTVRVRQMPRTPFVDGQPLPEDPFPSPIANAYTGLWARLFNLEYELLMLDIAWAFSQPRGGAGRAPMIGVAIAMMRNTIQPLSKDLCERSLADGSPLTAGPTYGLAREDVPADRTAYRGRYAALLERQAELLAAIEGAPEFGSDVSAPVRLAAIDQITNDRTPHLPGG